MQKLKSLLFLPLVFIISCSDSKELDPIVIQGQIINYNEDDLVLKNNFWEAIDTLKLTEGAFHESITVPNGYYYLSNGDIEFNIFLQSGKNLTVEFNTEDLQSLSISGSGANENKYLMSKSKMRALFDYRTLDEGSFLHKADSLKAQHIAHLENTNNVTKEFYSLEKSSILINHAIRLSQFEGRKRGMTNNPDFKVSDNYPNVYENIDLNDPQLMKTYRYKDLLGNYVSSQVIHSEGYSDSLDFFVLFQEYLSKSKLAPEIKDRLGLDNAEFGFTYSNNKKKYFETYLEFVQNESYKQRFTNSYNALQSKKGMPSPSFNFKGYDGQWYSLEHFRNKYVYIDLWASWCSPCIVQIPHLKRLEEKFKDKIDFVSIAWSDDYESWKNMISAKKMDGFQLFAEDTASEFFSFYDVQSSGIPRFILLDKAGNIIDSNAQQPSYPDLEEQLNRLE